MGTQPTGGNHANAQAAVMGCYTTAPEGGQYFTQEHSIVLLSMRAYAQSGLASSLRTFVCPLSVKGCRVRR